MVNVSPISIDGRTAIAVSVKLPQTHLVMVTTNLGYIMCGALDVALLNEKLAHRGILAARAVGVRTIEELLAAPLESTTLKAQELGIVPGVTGRDAIKMLLDYEEQQQP